MTKDEEKAKAALEKRLIRSYGEQYKTPLAADLGVDVSTIRRIFNRAKPLDSLYVSAIENQLSQRGEVKE